MSAPKYTIQWYRDCYAVVWPKPGGGRHRYSLGTADKSEAEREARRTYEAYQPPIGTSVGELWAAYIAKKESPVTARYMNWTWTGLLRERFGPMLAQEIGEAEYHAHIKARRDAGTKDGTIWTELNRLSMVLNWAKKQKLIDDFVPVIRPPKPDSTVPHLTRAEVARLLACTVGYLKLYITIAVATAARDEAIRDLTWDRVDFSANVIRLKDPAVTYKQKGRPDVVMNSMVRTALDAEARRVIKENGKLQGYVISYHGHRVGSVKKSLAAAGRRAEILHHLHPHMLRHTAAVHMLQAGKPLLEVSQILGHKNVRVTQEIYGRFAPHELSKAASVLVYDEQEGKIQPHQGSNEPLLGSANIP
jgi:integrase